MKVRFSEEACEYHTPRLMALSFFETNASGEDEEDVPQVWCSCPNCTMTLVPESEEEVVKLEEEMSRVGRVGV